MDDGIGNGECVCVCTCVRLRVRTVGLAEANVLAFRAIARRNKLHPVWLALFHRRFLSIACNSFLDA